MEDLGVELVPLPPINGIAGLVRTRTAARKLEPFDVLVCGQASFRTNLLYPLVRGRRKVGFDRVRARDGHRFFVHEQVAPADEHLADGFLRLAGKAAGRDEPLPFERFAVPVDVEAEEWAERTIREHATSPVLAIAPRASKPERDWPAERLVELCRRIDVPLVLVGDANSSRIAKQVVAAVGPRALDLTGRTNLRQLVALLAACDGLVSPDSGPVHLAEAVGTPVVGLYAVARSELTGPYLDRRFVVDAYTEAAGADAKWHERARGVSAMRLVEVDAVEAAVHRLLASLV